MAAAGDVMHDVWTKQCLNQVRTDGERPYQNGYTGKDGRRYFWDVSRKEHDDGAITGTTWRYLPDGEHVTSAGSWRINPDGTVKSYPTAWPFPKDSVREVVPMFTLPDKDQCHVCSTIAEYGDRFCGQCGTRLSTIDAYA
jgi:hypothetical protein